MDTAAAVVRQKGWPVKAVAGAFGVSRSQLWVRVRDAQLSGCASLHGQRSSRAASVKGECPPGPNRREPLTEASTAADAADLAEIRALVHERQTYGYRRAAAMINRRRRAEGRRTLNHKRAYRLMRDNSLLLQRHTGAHPGRVHDGTVEVDTPNTRWCSDSFEIRCWNGNRVYVAFSLDCCDRQAMSFVASKSDITGEQIRDLMLDSMHQRFGASARQVPDAIQWLSDNGGCYSATETINFAEALGLIPCFTPPYSPQSNGMAESFVKSFKRDYVYVNELPDADSVIAKLAEWFHDYNHLRPHKALKMMSPLEYQQRAA